MYFEKVYTLHDLRVITAESKGFVTSALVRDVFGLCPIVLKTEDPAFQEDATAFIDALEALPNMYL